MQIGDRANAFTAFRRSLETVLHFNDSASLRALIGFADLKALEQREEAAALYYFVIEHPGMVHSDAERAQRNLAALNLTKTEQQKAQKHANKLTLAETAQGLLGEKAQSGIYLEVER